MSNRMNAGQWYASIPRNKMPRFGYDMQRFLSPVVSVLAGSLPNIPAVVWSSEIDTAAADRKNNRIILGTRVFDADPQKRLNPKADVVLVIGSVLGFQIHEALHLAYTPVDDLTGFMNPGVPVNQLSTSVANIIEDLYIESVCYRFDPTMQWTLCEAWDYMFTPSLIKERLAEWDGNPTKDFGPIINVMVCWKNHNHNFKLRTPFEKKLNGLAMEAIEMEDFQQRKDLIEKIYRLLIDESGANEEEIPQAEEPTPGEGAGDLYEAGGKIISASGISEIIGEKAQSRQIKQMSLTVNGLLVCFKEVKESSSTLPFDQKWRRFAELAASNGAIRVVRGNASFRGKLTHPSRLYDDGKIWSQQQQSTLSGRLGEGYPQNIIVLDASGSMSTDIRGSRGKSRLTAACEAALGAMIGLEEGRQSVAVYAHTTGRDFSGNSGYNAVIYILKKFEERSDKGRLRIQGMNEIGPQEGNADGDVLLAVAKKFTPSEGPKRIFIISDGLPSVSSDEDDAKNVCKRSVKTLRDSGVEVYSVSIDNEAWYDNNDIYGQEFNVQAQDPNVLRDLISKFV